MYYSKYSSVNYENGNVTWNGPLSVEKGNHSNMPSRTEAYLPGDERGHVNASSLAGDNSTANVVPQHYDLNHGGYLSIENGERNALKSGATIHSEKTAYVDSQSGNRPNTFVINDIVTYADGHSETVHNSFTNESNEDQVKWNEISSALPGAYDAQNPGDKLRDSMSLEEYSELMEETDETLCNLAEDYEPADFSGMPVSTYGYESVNSSVISSAVDSSEVSIDEDGVDDGLDF